MLLSIVIGYLSENNMNYLVGFPGSLSHHIGIAIFLVEINTGTF